MYRYRAGEGGLCMISTATMRRLGAWLAGLFLIAQIFGVVPLLSEHTTHETESALVLSNKNARIGSIPQGHHHHHHGDADGFIQHHELQDLSGAFTCLASQCDVDFVQVAITLFVPDALAEADPTPLERPPKPLLFV
jgi:hypothetical protein